MPLLKGRGKKIIGKNIGEMVKGFKSKGKIGTSTPSSLAKAMAQASAISYKLAGQSKKKGY